VLGNTLEHLQERLGPPHVRGKGDLIYDIRGCTVIFYLKGGAVASYDASVSERCHPVIGERAVTERTTFGALRDFRGSYAADCVDGCGNAYDPPTYLIARGGKSSPDVLFYSSGLEGPDPTEDYPSTRWADAIKAKQGLGSDDTPENLDIFACVTDPPAPVIRALDQVRVEGVMESPSYFVGCGRERRYLTR
jgi:hypothetical protein